MTDKCIEFSNPDNLPVEKLTLEVKNAGVVQKIKALDTYWVNNRELLLYEEPPSGADLILGAVDAWQSHTEAYLADLKWLLSLEHHKFWSTILYHPNCMDCLVSFLQEASPPYIRPHDSRDVQRLYGEVRRYVLIVFSRLITNKESKSQWMSKEYMSQLLYDNFVFTIPILWDICLVYGVDNAHHVCRLVTSVFTLQPRYERDAAAAVAFVNESFKYIILQVNKDYDSEEPPNLPETFQGFGEIRRPSNNKRADKLTFSILKDLVIYLLDTAMTLRIFVEAYHKSVDIFRKTNFVNSIVQLYEYGIPHLYEKLEEVGDETSVSFTEVEGHIDSARAELIDIFREVLAAHKNAILSSDKGSIASHVEAFLTVMMDGLSERLLIKDYHACYPVHEDLEMLRQAYPDIDTVKTDFILQAIYSNIDEPVPEHLLNHQPLTNGHVEPTNEQPAPSTSSQSAPTIPDNLKQEALITEVRDVLPHLGDGFILQCLQHYGFNSERVVSSILEDSLPESLKDVDQTLPIIPEDPLDQNFLTTGIERLNVFDGDEFDIMTRDDVDVSRIHVGKRRSKYKNIQDMLDDKTDINKKLDFYNKYSLVEDSIYCDEYDDTYDSDGVSPKADSTETRRPFVTPRALETHRHREVAEESEEEPEHPQEIAGNSRSKLDFCANPAEVRARREANFQARRGRGQRPPPKSGDVVGKPRGQGQDKDVLVSRDRKEQHKSSRGNHSRRQGAQWKRSQGMMPS